MRRLGEAPEPIVPETDEERALLAMAVSVRPARNTSLNMCEKCASDRGQPGGEAVRDLWRADRHAHRKAETGSRRAPPGLNATP